MGLPHDCFYTPFSGSEKKTTACFTNQEFVTLPGACIPGLANSAGTTNAPF